MPTNKNIASPIFPGWLKLDGLKPRDRIALAVGGVAVALSFLWFVFLGPLHHKAERLAQRISAREADLQWMRRSAREIHRLRENAALDGEMSRSESLLTVVDRSAKKAGIAQAIKRIEPAGEAGARVWVEAATFDNLLLWLGDLRASGARIDAITVERRKASGRVNAKTTLEWL